MNSGLSSVSGSGCLLWIVSAAGRENGKLQSPFWPFWTLEKRSDHGVWAGHHRSLFQNRPSHPHNQQEAENRMKCVRERMDLYLLRTTGGYIRHRQRVHNWLFTSNLLQYNPMMRQTTSFHPQSKGQVEIVNYLIGSSCCQPSALWATPPSTA